LLHFFPASSHIQRVYSFDVLSTAIITGCPGERAFCAVNVRYSRSQQKRDLRTALFWVVTRRVAAISYRRFETTYQSLLKGILDPPEFGPTGYPETSIRNYCHALRNNPEERSSHLLAAAAWITLQSALYMQYSLSVYNSEVFNQSFFWGGGGAIKAVMHSVLQVIGAASGSSH
jgi:hypothetical protein